jgi:folate-binding protein YgfZ
VSRQLAGLSTDLRLGITEGVAELGQDKTLWLECNAAELAGVSFTKGCYVGQEIPARMNYRSKVNRRLVVVPATEAGDRTRIHYPALGFAVEHRRIEDLGLALRPAWLQAALAGK